MGCATAIRSSHDFSQYVSLNIGLTSTTEHNSAYIQTKSKLINSIKDIFYGKTNWVPISIDTLSSNKYITVNSDVSKDRDEKYIASIEIVYSFLYLSDNWDGYGGVSPQAGLIESVVNFISTIKNNSKILPPKVMLSGDGEISLLWQKGDLYIEIGFDDENQYSFLVNHENITIGKDDCDFSSQKIDAELLFYLRK